MKGAGAVFIFHGKQGRVPMGDGLNYCTLNNEDEYEDDDEYEEERCIISSSSSSSITGSSR